MLKNKKQTNKKYLKNKNTKIKIFRGQVMWPGFHTEQVS